MIQIGQFEVADWILGSIALLLAFVVMIWLAFYLNRQRRAALEQAAARAAEYPSDSVAEKPTSTKLTELVNFKSVLSEYEKRKNDLDHTLSRIEARQRELSARYLESMELRKLLQQASPQELEGLARILGVRDGAQADEIADALRSAGSNATASSWRKLRGNEPHVPYREVLDDVARKLLVKTQSNDKSYAKLEQQIVATALQKLLDEARPEERQQLLRSLDQERSRLAGTVGYAAGALVVANLSGFGLYIAASSLVSTLAGAIGLTLPFAFYTGMSSVIARLIGPVAWVALLLGGGAMLVGGVDYKKTVPAVYAIAAIRARLLAERDRELAELNAEQKGQVAEAATKVALLRELLDRMQREDLKQVPKEDMPI